MRISVPRHIVRVAIRPAGDLIHIDLELKDAFPHAIDDVSAPYSQTLVALTDTDRRNTIRSRMTGAARYLPMAAVVGGAFLVGHLAFGSADHNSGTPPLSASELASRPRDDPAPTLGKPLPPASVEQKAAPSRTIRQAPSPNADFGLD